MTTAIQEARTTYRKALDARKAALLAEITAVDREIAVLNSLAGQPPPEGQRPVRVLLAPRTKPSENPGNHEILPAIRAWFAAHPGQTARPTTLHTLLVEAGLGFKGRDPVHALRSRLQKWPGQAFLVDRAGVTLNPNGPLAPATMVQVTAPDPHQGEHFPLGGV